MYFHKLNSYLLRVATPRSIIITFLSSHLTLVTMMTFTLPKINAQLGDKAFDLQTFGYSSEKAKTLLGNLNQETINFYLYPQLLFLDILYPALLGTFLSLLTIRLSSINNHKPSNINNLLFSIPFITMSFDYLENICIIQMITSPITTTDWLINISSTLTFLKSVSTMSSWLIITALFLKWVIKKDFGIKIGEDNTLSKLN